jgi:hypothetical protein
VEAAIGWRAGQHALDRRTLVGVALDHHADAAVRIGSVSTVAVTAGVSGLPDDGGRGGDGASEDDRAEHGTSSSPPTGESG